MTRRVRCDVGGFELAAMHSGPLDGVPVMLLHGFTGAAEAMAPLQQRLTAPGSEGHRGQQFLTVAVDLVGHGRSEVPEEPGRYNVPAMAQHVSAVADSLGHETFHLVGYSMGGRVALTLACDVPQRLRSLTLIGATAGIADAGLRQQRQVHDAALADLIEADFAAFVDRWMANPLFAGQAALGESHLQAARRQRLRSDPAGLARSLRFGGTGSMPPLHAHLKSVDTPTLLVVGEQDTKFCAIAKDLHAELPQAKIAHIVGAGHAAHIERSDATGQAISAFINSCQSQCQQSMTTQDSSRGTSSDREPSS